MVRSSLKLVLSLCLIAAAGYGAYLPFEIIRSHQIEEASKPLVANALLAELKSQAQQKATHAAATADLVSKGGRITDIEVNFEPGLNDKTL